VSLVGYNVKWRSVYKELKCAIERPLDERVSYQQCTRAVCPLLVLELNKIWLVDTY
jgi:hypothetical protein